MNDRIARAALSRLGEPGDLRLAAVVAELGAGRVFDLLRAEQDVSGVYTDVAQRLRGLDPERELDAAAARGIRFVCPGDDEWPEQLGTLTSADPVNGRGGAPLGLWVTGPLSLAAATRGSVAVVGSRSATTYGADVAGEMSAHIAGAGVTVVSGAAFGIDVAAHRGALAARGPTVAVLACGVDRAYPAGNAGRHRLHRPHRAGRQRAASWLLADPASLSQPEPCDRGALCRHPRRRGSHPKRGTQHGELGGSTRPRGDGSARAGHERAVPGRARAASGGRCPPRDPRRARPRARVACGRPPCCAGQGRAIGPGRPRPSAVAGSGRGARGCAGTGFRHRAHRWHLDEDGGPLPGTAAGPRPRGAVSARVAAGPPGAQRHARWRRRPGRLRRCVRVASGCVR